MNFKRLVKEVWKNVNMTLDLWKTSFVLLFATSIIFSGEYGGWREALDAEDYRSVFVLAEPAKIPRHNFYEFVWLLKTGGPRVVSKEREMQNQKSYLSVHLHMFYST